MAAGFGGSPPYQPPGYPAQGPGQASFGVDPKTGMPFSDKQKVVAGLLQLFIGCFAVGRFYTGHFGLAIIQIAVTWLTCGLGALWPFIDGIWLLTADSKDSQGRPLRS